MYCRVWPIPHMDIFMPKNHSVMGKNKSFASMRLRMMIHHSTTTVYVKTVLTRIIQN